MTVTELKEALGDQPSRSCVMVVTRSGNLYWLHGDQLPALEDNCCAYGFPVKPHPRQRGRKWQWLNIANLRIAEPDDQINI